MAVALAHKLRDTSLADARASYEELISITPTKKDLLRRTGLSALDHFFLAHRLKTKTRRHLSFYDAMKNPKTRAHLSDLVVRYKKKPLSSYDSTHLLKAQYDVFQLYYGTVNQFRPIVAKWVYLRYNPRHGILDVSAGWGGRALAALSLGIPYRGIDANRHLEPAYRQMIHALEPNASPSRIHLHFQPAESVDFSAFRDTYDLVFTSPPYFTVEEYEGMPTYSTKEDFLRDFFLPVTLAAWKNLRRRGYMALNMPKEMYDAVKGHLPPLYETLSMPLANRHPTNAARTQRLGKTNSGTRTEKIYVWRKG